LQFAANRLNGRLLQKNRWSFCGHRFRYATIFKEYDMNAELNDREGPDDWDKRLLCSDGSCIGIIGPDGSCKECGKPYEGTLPVDWQASPAADLQGGSTGGASQENDALPVNSMPANTDKASTVTDAHQQSDDRADIPDRNDGGPDYWEQRTLCPDGNCIGVIGPDGRCKECGKASS
jgi:hypothetical protein